MWSYNFGALGIVIQFYHITLEKLWKVFFKPQHEWPAEEEDVGLDASNPPLEASDEELSRLNSRLDEKQAMDLELEKLHAELEKAKEEATTQKMVAEKTATELDSLKVMESYTLNKREHYENVLGGPFLMELVLILNLPIPEIKVTKRKYGSWGIRTRVFGRKEDPKSEYINYGTLYHDCDIGMNTRVHDAIGSLRYRRRVELGNHYFGRFGWEKADGAYIILTDIQKMKFSPLFVYNQELEQYIKKLQMDHLGAIFEKEALR
ncbi:hypothetical protein D1007_05933 [Hordeum vulgare]|nr:hypothetical protein D1007_05933 [Hordeum vulgare]